MGKATKKWVALQSEKKTRTHNSEKTKHMSFEHKNFSTRIYTPKKGKNFVEVEGMEPQGQSKETIFAPELSVHREKPAASKKKKNPQTSKEAEKFRWKGRAVP